MVEDKQTIIIFSVSVKALACHSNLAYFEWNSHTLWVIYYVHTLQYLCPPDSDGGLETWSCLKTGLVSVSGLEISVSVSVLCAEGLSLAQSNLPRPPRPQKF